MFWPFLKEKGIVKIIGILYQFSAWLSILAFLGLIVNNAFLQENQILRDADKLKDIPGTIVQGRYDLICPLESAWELHQAWHGSDLYIIGDAGHSATEVGIVNALVKATRKMLKRIE